MFHNKKHYNEIPYFFNIVQIMKLSLTSIPVSCAAFVLVGADLLGATEENQFQRLVNKKKNTHVSQSNHHNGDSSGVDSPRAVHEFSFADESVESSLAAADSKEKNDIIKEDGHGFSRQLENDDDDVILIDQEDHKIVGGEVVDPPFKYPFMVRVGGWCGASLVAHNVLLTAAHCGSLSNLRVQIGKHDIRNNQEDYEEFDIEMVVPHPQYGEEHSWDNDIMMVKLSGSSRFQPVELDDGTEAFAEYATVMGWGHTEHGGESSKLLRSVDVDVYSDAECKEAYPAVTDRMFCAGAEGKDSCQGDSGGPIIDSVTQKQIGIVSWGSGCAQKGGVYAKVRKQIEWIKTQIDTLSKMTPSPTPTPTCFDAYHWQENDPWNLGCNWYESDETHCEIFGNEPGTDGYGNPMNANEACCYCGGGTGTAPPTPAPVTPPTPPLCSDLTKRRKCNRTYGCSWFRWKCLDASPNDECITIGNWRKCRKNGCKWAQKKCTGRWDY